MNSDSITGFFGRLTEKATAKFQKENGLIANPAGFVGAGTRAKILALSCGGQTNTTNTSNTNVNNSWSFSNNLNLPAGCTSTVGFISISGNACDGTLPP